MILLKKSTLTLYNLTCTYENNNRPNIMFPSKSFNFYPKLYFIISKMEIFQEIKLYGIFSINCYNRLTIQIIYSRFKILKYNFSLTTYNVSIYDRLYSHRWTHTNLGYRGIGRSNCKTGAIHGIILNVRNETGLGFSPINNEEMERREENEECYVVDFVRGRIE